MTLESLNPLFLQHYINAMLHTPKSSGKAGTLSQGTIKRRAAVLSAMLSQAVRWNLIESNPMDRVQVKKNDSTEEKLQFFTQEQARQHLLIGTQWQGENHIFIQWNGRQMGLETPYQAFHRIINNYNANRSPDAPELPLIPLHGLRHTAATLLIGSGVDVRTVSGRLGHSNTSTTLNIYSHALKELDRKASDPLASALIKKA